MTDEKAIRILLGKATFFSNKENSEDTVEALKMGMQAIEKMSFLTDRPCEACRFHKKSGCVKWSCVFENSENRCHEIKTKTEYYQHNVSDYKEIEG